MKQPDIAEGKSSRQTKCRCSTVEVSSVFKEQKESKGQSLVVHGKSAGEQIQS